MPGGSGEPSTSDSIGKQVALLVGGAAMVVLALYMMTLISKQNVTSGGAESALPPSALAILEDHETEPLPED
ncbi:MAG: hypothetical protein ACOCTG_04050, partial [Bacteroidota bacterium]